MQFGDLRIEVISDTEFGLDGGAMFGVVPKVLWQRVSPPDDANRIRMNMNCLFIDTGKQKIIVETGIGEKWTEKDAAMYAIDRKRSFAESLFAQTGCTTDDIDIVINTHLHFDHCGGNTISNAEKALPQFKNARYLIGRAEYEHANSPSDRDRGSYINANWSPLDETGQIELMPDIYFPIAGMTVETNAGHNLSMQTVKIEQAGQILYGFADLIPTRHHLKYPWIMGYDLYPMKTLEFKHRVIPQAVSEGWLCWLYHDPDMPFCRFEEVGGSITATKYDSSK